MPFFNRIPVLFIWKAEIDARSMGHNKSKGQSKGQAKTKAREMRKSLCPGGSAAGESVCDTMENTGLKQF